MTRLPIALIALLCVAPTFTFAAADPKPPRAARSVHLWWPAPEATVFYNEMTVDASTPGSYFMACGFSLGYFGMQELADGKKVVIFSVWDPGQQDDPKSVPAERRVEMLHQGEGVRVGRFGGEGTGGQSFFDYPWAIGETCRFCLRAVPGDKDRTAYEAYFFLNDARQWKHLATFRTLSKGDQLKGLYSFVEDFRRDGKSVNERRSARYGNGWAKTTKGDWVSLCRTRFTADNTPLTNVDAAVRDDGRTFSLTTGGDTRNVTPLNATLERPPSGVAMPEFK